MKKLNKIISLNLIVLLFVSMFSINIKLATAAVNEENWMYCNLENETVLDDSNKEIHFGLSSKLSNKWTFYVHAGTKEIKIYRHSIDNSLAHAKYLLVGGMQNATPDEYKINKVLPIKEEVCNSGYNNTTGEPIIIDISENAEDGHNIMIYSQEIKSANFTTTNALINLVIIGDKSPKSLRVINKTNSSETEEFVYHIKGIDEANSDIDFFITCKSNSDVMIKDLPMGEYKVEQDESWNISYKTKQSVQTVELDEDKELIFENEKSIINWLVSVTKSIINIFKK